MKLEDLLEQPDLILNLDQDFGDIIDEIPRLINPLINSSCAIDEIYIDGLDATQIWPQVQMVLDNIEVDLKEQIGKLEINSEESEQEMGSEEEEEENAFGDQMDEDSEEEEQEEELEEESEEELKQEGEEEEEEEEGLEQQEDLDSEEVEDLEEELDGDFDIKPKKNDKFGLNDDFFDLEAYQKQVLALEDKDALDDDEDADDGEEIDLFADMDDEDDDDEEMYTYGDFFKGQVESKKELEKAKPKAVKGKKKKAKDFNEGDFNDAYESAMADMMGDLEEDEEDDEEEEIEEEEEQAEPNPETLSTFEKQQLALQKEIAELEKESIAEKKWTMKGEVTAKQRGVESALTEELEFDRNAKPVPVVTQEFTESIEDIIRRRIKNDQYDDIPKRIISDISNFKPSSKLDIDERQSKKSLAEIYEDEYNNEADHKSKASEELQTAHNEITSLWDKVNWELDSLYSANFIPKPKQKLLDVKVQTSTVTLEDAQPLTMGDTQRLAPQEIYKIGTKIGKDEVQLKSGVVMSKAELDREDKARLRRAKKRKQHNQDKDESIKKKKVSTEQL